MLFSEAIPDSCSIGPQNYYRKLPASPQNCGFSKFLFQSYSYFSKIIPQNYSPKPLPKSDIENCSQQFFPNATKITPKIYF